MDVLIRLDREDPPAGTVLRLREREGLTPEAKEALPFVGWLGLLRALSEVVRETGESAIG